jgi:hypothetical protein
MNSKKIISTLEIKNNQIVSLDYIVYKKAIELAEKGEDEGIEYLIKLIKYRVHKANQIVSHRLHGHNNIYEEILDALLSYYSKKSDNNLKETALNIIKNGLSEIIFVSKETNIDLSILAYTFKGDEYDDCSEFKLFKNDLEKVYTFLINKIEKTDTDNWNIKTIKTILDMWGKDKFIDLEKELSKNWTDSEKASYWVGKFHQWMRWVGEDGLDEVEFFEPKSFKIFREEEPYLDRLMPLILTQLATAWMFDIDDFFERVNYNLGTNYKRDNT